MEKLHVSDLMTTSVFALLPDDTLAPLHALMDGWRVRHAPVVDESNALLGVVSERDLLRRTPLGRHDATQEEVEESLATLRVKDVMTAVVETARPEEEVDVAARRMFDGKLGCLPVVSERQHLLGILTEADFVRYFAEHG